MSEAVLLAIIGAVPATIGATAALLEAIALYRDKKGKTPPPAEAEAEAGGHRASGRRVALFAIGTPLVTLVVVLVAALVIPDSADDDAPKPLTVQVAGRLIWTDTGITLKAGDTLRISADGEVFHNEHEKTGPSGIPGAKLPANVVKDANHNALIAQIGQHPPFYVGSAYSAYLTIGGLLKLGVNDTDTANNSGAYTAKVAVERG